MSHQQLDSLISRCLFLQPSLSLGDPLVERDQQRDQVFRLVFCHWCHASIFQSLLPGPAEHPRSFRQTAADGNGLQVVTDHRTHLDQPCAVSQHPQDLNAFPAVAVDPGEIPFEHDFQNQLSIPTIIFLSPVCSTPNLGGMPYPYRVTKFFEHRFKPGAVPAGFQPYDHLAGELRVELAYIVLAMIELGQLNLSIGRVTVSYRLHPRVKIHAAIYWFHHSASPQRSTVRRASESISRAPWEAPRFITSLLWSAALRVRRTLSSSLVTPLDNPKINPAASCVEKTTPEGKESQPLQASQAEAGFDIRRRASPSLLRKSN